MGISPSLYIHQNICIVLRGLLEVDILLASNDIPSKEWHFWLFLFVYNFSFRKLKKNLSGAGSQWALFLWCHQWYLEINLREACADNVKCSRWQVLWSVFGEFIHTRSFQKKAHQEVVGQTGIGVTTKAIYGTVNVHHDGNLSAFLKRRCQHSKMLDAEYQKNAMRSFKFKTFGLKKNKRKLDKNLKKELLEWQFLREHRKLY